MRGLRKAALKFLGAAILTVATVLCPVPGARAANPFWQPKIYYSIDSKSLRQAVREWAIQSNQDVLTSLGGPEVQAPALHGWYTPEAALRKLLERTGWTYCRVRENAFAISTITKTNWQSEGCKALAEEYALQQAVVEQSTGDPNAGKSQGVPEIVVRGTRSLNAEVERSPDNVQPYVIFNRETIEKSGAENVEDFLKRRLTMQSGLSGNPAEQGYTVSRNIGLRGLAPTQTLILIDGRRAPSSSISGTVVPYDINGIPLSQIERIEVLPATAAGIYGGSATGGVINIILRRNYQGLETRFKYGNTFSGGGNSRRIGINGGTAFNGGNTHLMFGAEHADSNPVTLGDRAFLLHRGQDAAIAYSGSVSSMADPPLGATTNIRSATGSNLTLKDGTPLNSPITHVPVKYAGVATDKGAALVANAGQYNFNLANTAQLSGANAALADAPTTDLASMSIEHVFANKLRLFADSSYSRSRSRVPMNRMDLTYNLPADAPTNPFQQSVRLTVPARGADTRKDVELETSRFVLGGTYKLNNGLQLSLDHVFSRVRYKGALPGGISEEGRSALESGALNVLRDINIYKIEFASLRTVPSAFSDSTTRLQDTTLRAIGTLRLPILNDVKLGSLIEHRRESLGQQDFTDATMSSTIPERSQQVTSVLVDIRKEFISVESSLSGARSLELQLAGRFDDYQTHGADLSTGVLTRANNRVRPFSPTLGIRFQPQSEMTFRASYGKGFLPPAANQLMAASPIYIRGSLLGLRDPMRGDEPLGTIRLDSGGNAELRAEISRSFSAGFVFNPYYYHDIRLSVDWNRTTIEGEIENIPLSQDPLDRQNLLPKNIIGRADPSPGDPWSVGVITSFNAGQTNLGRRKNDAIDIAFAAGSIPLWIGDLAFSAAATKQLKSQTQLTPLGPWTEYSGLVQSPEWKAIANLDWRLRDWDFIWTSRYTSRYWLNPDHELDTLQGSATVHSQIYHDMLFQFTEPTGSGWFSDFQLQFGVTNVLGKMPPKDMSATVVGAGRYSPLGDPQGATWFFNLRKTW